MKPHFVIKLFHQLSDSRGIPYWIDFINNKSVILNAFIPDIDQLIHGFGLTFWVTHEYKSAAAEWSADELREGLDRTYRLILQRDYSFPDDLLARIKRISTVEDARELMV